jgi:hypothetical protein
VLAQLTAWGISVLQVVKLAGYASQRHLKPSSHSRPTSRSASLAIYLYA